MGRLAQTSETVCWFSEGTGGLIGLYFRVSSTGSRVVKSNSVVRAVYYWLPLRLARFIHFPLGSSCGDTVFKKHISN